MIERKALLFALGAVLIAGPAFADSDCDYKGATYSNGSALCQSGTQYRCNNGRWNGLAIACSDNQPAAARNCAFNGGQYSPGSTSCQSDIRYRCDDGSWVSLAAACTASGQIAARVAPDKQTCTYNGATVATESTICKGGITFRCEAGEWRNLGTACR